MRWGSGQLWNDAQDNALKVAIAEGCSFAQAAMVVNDLFNTNYTRNAAIGRANRLGLTQPTKVRQIATIAQPARNVIRRHHRAPVPQTPPAPSPRPCTVYPEADVIPRHLTLQQLTDATCKWPYGEGPYTFCGCETFAGGPYCEPHQALSVGRGTGEVRDAHRISRSVE